VILLQSGTDPSVEACRRGQPAIVGGQRGGGVLGDHEPRTCAFVRRQEGGQTAHQRVHQAIHAAFRHGRHFRDGNAERIGHETECRADGVCARQGPWLVRGAHDDRVVGHRSQFIVHHPGRVRE
jgi:hypothetical protein